MGIRKSARRTSRSEVKSSTAISESDVVAKMSSSSRMEIVQVAGVLTSRAHQSSLVRMPGASAELQTLTRSSRRSACVRALVLAVLGFCFPLDSSRDRWTFTWNHSQDGPAMFKPILRADSRPAESSARSRGTLWIADLARLNMSVSAQN
jgi:hypothetical protein